MTSRRKIDLSDFPLPLHEPFTPAEAMACGIPRHRLRTLCERGFLRVPVRGVLVDSSLPDTLDLRARCLQLVVPPGCFVCDRTAGWLHGANMILAPNDHLAVPAVSMYRHADAGRLRNKLSRSGERTLLPQDLMSVNGILVTTPLRTALDLGRFLNRDQALAAMDSLLALGDFSHDELLGEIRRFARQRGVVQLRWLAPLADAQSRSPGESALRLRWYDAGLPRPRLQIAVVENGRTIFYLDMGLEELLLAAEYDGAEWHTDEDAEHDDSRRTWLKRQRGWRIEVFRSTNVFGPHQDATQRLAVAHREARATLGTRRVFI